MILEEIAEYTRKRIEQEKQEVDLETMKKMAKKLDAKTGFPFEVAMRNNDISFICEVKKASPSKGIITKDFPYKEIAREYQEAGASAISVLTEPKYFKGQKRYLEEIAREVDIPLLRKDFTVDEYQIYEAKVLGASAVLLICAILEETVLKKYLQIAEELGLSALVEAHTQEEVEMALRAGSRIIGVNNRDLKTFNVNMETSIRLRKLVPEEIIYISESGISTPEDIRVLETCGVDGVLIGESFMRKDDKKAAMQHLKGKLENRGE